MGFRRTMQSRRTLHAIPMDDLVRILEEHIVLKVVDAD